MKGPGLVIIVPVIQQMVRVDLRTRVLDVPPQDVISRDNVSVRVNAVVYYRVIDPEKAIIQVEHFNEATSQLAQTTLRSVLGQHELDEMLAERDKLNADIRRILDEQTDAWGIKVSNVELKHVDLNETMIRAIAKQAEAERIRRAKVIDAEGEFQAAEKLAQAGEILASRPEAMQLRYLTALQNIAGERTSTIVFPIPADLHEACAEAEPWPALRLGRPLERGRDQLRSHQVIEQPAEVERVVGLGHEHRALDRIEVLDLEVPAGRVHHRQARPQLAGALRQRATVHVAGQVDVGEQQVDRLTGAQAAQRIAGVCHRAHFEPLLFQRFRRNIADRRLVLDQQDARALLCCHRSLRMPRRAYRGAAVLGWENARVGGWL